MQFKLQYAKTHFFNQTSSLSRVSWTYASFGEVARISSHLLRQELEYELSSRKAPLSSVHSPPEALLFS